MLPLKKFVRYADYGNGVVAVFETGFKEFFEYIEYGTEVDGLPRTQHTVPDAADAHQAVSRADLEAWIARSERMGIDVSDYRRVLDKWPSSPGN